jgi:hypothetical protein
VSDTTTTESSTAPAPAPTPTPLEDAVGRFVEVWQHDDAIGEVATALECDEALTLAGVFRAAGMGDVGEQWLVTHHEFEDGCACLDAYFATRPTAGADKQEGDSSYPLMRVCSYSGGRERPAPHAEGETR